MSTMLLRGRIYSQYAPGATAMLIEAGQVAWVGEDDTAAMMVADEHIDLGGALVVPAFVDGHFHTTATGLALSGLDLAGTASLADALSAVAKYAQAARGRPLLGSGWDELAWPEQRPPTAAELDRASYGGVVYLARTDAHSAVASSALMATVPRLSGLDGYHPSGLLTKAAHHAVRAVALAAITPGQRSELQRTALRHAASRGIAAIHEMAGPEISSMDDLAELGMLSSSEPLPRVFGFWGELGAIATAQQLGAVCVGGDLFCDGSVGSHTAALLQPYEDHKPQADAKADAGRGYLRYELAELVEHIVACSVAGMLTGFHAIGDAAIERVVQAMVVAEQSLGGARVSGAGHRIEHAELVPDVSAFAAAGLTASMQPSFDATWGGATGMYQHRLGAERASSMNQFAQLAAAGVPLVFGSDSPVTPADPWAAVRAAVYPTSSHHAISPRAAFAAHTRGGWRSVRAANDGAGVLNPGSPATYAIFESGGLGVDAVDVRLSRWSTDERAAVPGLPDLTPGLELPRCLRTVLDGEIIYDSGELT